MNDDYLWDKSGEPDPQIQELEELLAPLRYQPTPLILPVTRKRNYLPLLAIAATVLIALLVGGVWLRLRTEKAAPPQEAKSQPSVPSVNKQEIVKTTNTDSPKKLIVRKPRPNRKFNREEALAAKEQLMVALRLASEKLKSAQRRTQSSPGASPNQIKNQHKVG
jgi:negative regulator of sigma E activity